MRYRNATLLAAVLVLQLILLGYQVRRDDGSSMLNSWAVGAVAPLNKLLHGVFDFGSSRWKGYVWLVGARSENDRMRRELDDLRLENQALRRAVGRIERSVDLIDYQSQTPSQTLLAEVIGGGGAGAREIMLDRGTQDGVLAGMAAMTSVGIVGKVRSAHPRSSLVVLINNPDAAAGVILGDSRVRGVLKGRGEADCRLEYVAPEVPVRVGEIVYTSGDDRIYPKGLPVGEVTRLAKGAEFHQIWVRPFSRLDRLDEVLVVVSGVHQSLPPPERPAPPAILLPPPAAGGPLLPTEGMSTDRSEAESEPAARDSTDADRLRSRYLRLGAAQNHTFGEGLPGSRPPDFNLGEPVPPSDAPISTAITSGRGSPEGESSVASALPESDSPASSATLAPQP